MTYSYTDPAHKQAVTGISGGMSASYSYGQRGNMLARTVNNLTYTQTFDVEGRLDSVTVGGQMTTFTYDDAGNRVLAVYNSGTIQATNVYTPFPDYEVEDPPTGDNITRTTYRLAGQMVAVQKRVGAGAGTFAYTYTDHLGNLVALSSLTGVLDATSLARYDPFGNYRTTPATNPGMTDQGFTGHRHNNTGTNNLGLIYMNARYYLPEVGRFVSADSIVPEASNPQSFNRYSYSFNNPINYTDPSGYDPLDSAWEEAFCNEHFGGMDGCTITDEDRRDRLFSVIFPGSGAGGAWTAEDWAFYFLNDNKADLWAGNRPWTYDVPQGLDRFLSHLDRLASYYNPGEEAAFVKAVGNVWGGIPFGFPVMSAIHVRNGPALPILQEGNANWVPDLVDDEQPAHHYAGLFYAGFFFGADHAAAVNWLRDGPISNNNPPDLRLGYVAGLQGDLLWGRFLSVSQVSTAARYALDARLTTWPESPRPWDYLFYWSIPYGGR